MGLGMEGGEDRDGRFRVEDWGARGGWTGRDLPGTLSPGALGWQAGPHKLSTNESYLIR